MNNFENTRALLHNSDTFYLLKVNMDSTYGYVNNHYKKLFKGKHDNLVGQHYSMTIHPDDMEVCKKVAEQCFATPEKIFPATIRKHDGNGGYIATQWDYKAILDDDGNPIGILCIGYDITEFIKTTAALSQVEFVQSHIIRKPIANILGLIDLLKKAPLPAETGQLIGMIDQAAVELDNYLRSSEP